MARTGLYIVKALWGSNWDWPLLDLVWGMFLIFRMFNALVKPIAPLKKREFPETIWAYRFQREQNSVKEMEGSKGDSRVSFPYIASRGSQTDPVSPNSWTTFLPETGCRK